LHSFYSYSLEAFISITNRAIDEVSIKAPALLEANSAPVQRLQSGEQADDSSSRQSVDKEFIEEAASRLSAQSVEKEEPLTPKGLKKRIKELVDAITYGVFKFVR